MALFPLYKIFKYKFYGKDGYLAFGQSRRGVFVSKNSGTYRNIPFLNISLREVYQSKGEGFPVYSRTYKLGPKETKRKFLHLSFDPGLAGFVMQMIKMMVAEIEGKDSVSAVAEISQNGEKIPTKEGAEREKIAELMEQLRPKRRGET